MTMDTFTPRTGVDNIHIPFTDLVRGSEHSFERMRKFSLLSNSLLLPPVFRLLTDFVCLLIYEF